MKYYIMKYYISLGSRKLLDVDHMHWPPFITGGQGPTVVSEIVDGWPVCVSFLKIMGNVVQVNWRLICIQKKQILS